MRKLIYILIGIICLLVIILIVNLYLYWKSTVNDNNGYNSINALIALLALLVNIITIFFLYFNYQQQQKHINKQEDELKNNRNDIEFNRTLDIIYKQLEYSQRKFSLLNLSNNLKEFVENLTDNRFYSFTFNITLDKELLSVNRILELLIKELELYNKIINSSKLDKDVKDYLIELVVKNIYPKLDEAIDNLQNKYKAFKLNLEGYQKNLINDNIDRTEYLEIGNKYEKLIDKNLKIVLSLMNKVVIDGLNLKE